MRIRPLAPKDKATLLALMIKTRAFTAQEIDVAMELINVAIKDPDQKDYVVRCLVDDQDQPLGYVCYGPAPMTTGTFDLYWIAVDPDYQKQRIGSRLIDYLDEVVKGQGGRMILADTSTIPEYEKTSHFYLRNGFKEVAKIADYYGPGNDRVTFCKRYA
jgi:ribosomal protein S18 acetylase RimI-like enzyme